MTFKLDLLFKRKYFSWKIWNFWWKKIILYIASFSFRLSSKARCIWRSHEYNMFRTSLWKLVHNDPSIWWRIEGRDTQSCQFPGCLFWRHGELLQVRPFFYLKKYQQIKVWLLLYLGFNGLTQLAWRKSVSFFFQ